MATSPTQLTLKHLRSQGYTAAVVEHWNPHAMIRQDLFGFIDVLGVRKGEVLGVQATSYPNVASRVTKIANAEHIGAVRDAGIRIEVHGWRKVKNRWQCRVIDVS